jgi:hypothetical protein
MKKPCLKITVFSLFLFTHLFISCNNSGNGNQSVVIKPEDVTKTGSVTFFNESSYDVKIHRDSFSGPVVLELDNTTKQRATVQVRISDILYGTTFSYEYIVPIKGDDFDSTNEEIFASGFDFDFQPNYVIKEGESITVQIPNPTNIEFKTSFIIIYNIYNLPVELRYYGRTLKQAGSGVIPVAQEKFGIYKLEEIPADGEQYQGYKIVSTFMETPVPDFFVENGFKYAFTFDGTSVHDGSPARKPEPKKEPLKVGG